MFNKIKGYVTTTSLSRVVRDQSIFLSEWKANLNLKYNLSSTQFHDE